MSSLRARLIAFYLPQFHPIPENDAWWGKGFTEWSNVTRAKPLFPGHYQPRIPADLGFYDLRVPDTQAAQAEMAAHYGLEGFCYWHYWFAGKRLLERPFSKVLESGDPKFPFCLAWANQSWTGIWHGQPNRILIEQTYPGEKDYVDHFYAVVEAFCDPRYIRVEGKPLFVVYMPSLLPSPIAFTDLWNNLAVKEGLKGVFFIGIADSPWPINSGGFGGYTYHLPGTYVNANPKSTLDKSIKRITGYGLDSYVRSYLKIPKTIRYSEIIKHAFGAIPFNEMQYPSVLPNWDNTPRSGLYGLVLHQSSPELFRIHLRQAIQIVQPRDPEHRLVFIKSWNEWAEGNYLEPDLRYGHGYLHVIKDEVMR